LMNLNWSNNVAYVHVFSWCSLAEVVLIFHVCHRYWDIDRVCSILILLTLQIFRRKMQNLSFLLQRSCIWILLILLRRLLHKNWRDSKRTPSAKIVEREQRVGTLMSMRWRNNLGNSISILKLKRVFISH
jgi:hypothetical protein